MTKSQTFIDRDAADFSRGTVIPIHTHPRMSTSWFLAEGRDGRTRLQRRHVLDHAGWYSPGPSYRHHRRGSVDNSSRPYGPAIKPWPELLHSKRINAFYAADV